VDLRRTDQQLGLPPGSYAHALNADFSLYARANGEGNVSVGRVGDNEEIERLGATGSLPRAMRLSPDGRFLATRYGRRDYQTVIRDLESDQTVLQVASGSAMDFSADGRRVVLDRSDSSLGVYELPSGELLETFALRGKSACESVSFRPDGKRLAFVLRDASDRETRTVHLLDLQSMKVQRTLEHRSRVRGLAWHPSGQFLATGCHDMNVYVWDSSNGSLLEVLKGHEAEVVRVLFSPAGDLLASYSWDNTVRLWEPLTGRLLVTTPASGLDLQFSRNGEYLALLPSPSTDKASHIWQVASGRVLRNLHGHSRDFKGPFWVEVSPDGALLASTGYDGVRLWSLGEGKELHHLPLRLAEYSSALFDPSGRVLITSTVHGLQRWPLVLAGSILRVGPPKFSGSLARRELARASLAADGRTLAVIDSRTRRGLVYDLEGGQEKHLAGNRAGLATIDISADGRWVAAGTRGVSPGTTAVWDARSGSHVKDLSGGSSRVRFGPLGKWLVVSHPEEFLFHEVPSWELHHRLSRPRPWGGVSGPMAFTQDGSLLALAYSRNLVRLVDPSTGREIASLEAPEPRNITWLAFSPDGGRLAVATGRYVIQVWDLRQVRERLGDMGLDWDLPPYPPLPDPQRRESRTPR
jgi:WD40 repeat protein